MLLVFDLDDTLIDTFNSVTRPAYKALITQLNKRVDLLLPEKKALDQLCDLRCTRSSSRAAMQAFFKIYSIKEQLDWALDFVYCYNDYFDVTLSRGATWFLRKYQSTNKVIVTRGIEARQRKKIDKSSLSQFNFYKVVVVSSDDKSIAYQSLLDEYSPTFSVLIADRKEDFLNTEGLFTKRVLFTPSYFQEAKLDFFADLKLSNLKDLAGVLE